ncbi:MAG: hypothetical protein OEW16_12010 [Gammaproteobacteria bacterium]|nr:hypothetical protein [Gammaproteobacteria bacterium]
MANIAVGGFQHETNAFAELETGLAQFIEPAAALIPPAGPGSK